MITRVYHTNRLGPSFLRCSQGFPEDALSPTTCIAVSHPQSESHDPILNKSAKAIPKRVKESNNPIPVLISRALSIIASCPYAGRGGVDFLPILILRLARRRRRFASPLGLKLFLVGSHSRDDEFLARSGSLLDEPAETTQTEAEDAQGVCREDDERRGEGEEGDQRV